MTNSDENNEIRIVLGTLEEYRQVIWPLRHELFSSPERIGALANPYGIIRYQGREIFENILFFPIIAYHRANAVGATLVYNISDRTVRFNGIHVVPDYRNQGIGRRMVEFGISVWPEPWNKVLLLARTANVHIFQRWGFELLGEQKPRALTNAFFPVSEDRVLIMSRPFNSAHNGHGSKPGHF